MVIYDDTEFQELMKRFYAANDTETIKEVLVLFNKKIHDIYFHINNLETSLKGEINKLK